MESEPGSSVNIVSGYGLNNRAIEVLSPAETKEFFLQPCVQAGSGDNQASCKMGSGSLSTGLNLGRGVTLTPI
jgi:hypothetical protein